jgi:PAS domain-containing protein
LNADLGILEIPAGKVVYADQSACRFFGLPQEKMLSVAPEVLFEDNASDRVRRLLAETTTTAAEIGTRDNPYWWWLICRNNWKSRRDAAPTNPMQIEALTIPD